jgi:hypothetical protein
MVDLFEEFEQRGGFSDLGEFDAEGLELKMHQMRDSSTSM